MGLFSDFKVLNFFVMKNNVREILVQKQPQASLKENGIISALYV